MKNRNFQSIVLNHNSRSKNIHYWNTKNPNVSLKLLQIEELFEYKGKVNTFWDNKLKHFMNMEYCFLLFFFSRNNIYSIKFSNSSDQNNNQPKKNNQ